MKAKTIIVFFAVVLAGNLVASAGDQRSCKEGALKEKPFKGQVQQIAAEQITLDQVKNYPYLNEVINRFGEPDPVSLYFVPPQLVTFEGYNNVGGDSIHKNAQLFYLFPLPPDYSRFVMVYYEDSTITVANGDQIFVRVEGVYYSSIDKLIAKETVVGGTGRFEGAEGSFVGTQDVDRDGDPIIVYDGYITMSCKAEKH